MSLRLRPQPRPSAGTQGLRRAVAVCDWLVVLPHGLRQGVSSDPCGRGTPQVTRPGSAVPASGPHGSARGGQDGHTRRQRDGLLPAATPRPPSRQDDLLRPLGSSDVDAAEALAPLRF